MRRIRSPLPELVLETVPSMLHMDETAEMYSGWKEAGIDKMIMRPNDIHYSKYFLPLGMEKAVYDHFQLGFTHGIAGYVADSLVGHWPLYGLLYYVQAKMMIDPQKSFEFWEHEYCESFGAAAPLVMKYYRYYREKIWQEKISTDLARYESAYNDFGRWPEWTVFTAEDFDYTDALLERALALVSEPVPQRILHEKKLYNEFARLFWHASSTDDDTLEKYNATAKLLRFMVAQRENLPMRWESIFSHANYRDPAAILDCYAFRNCRNFFPLHRFPAFSPDPENKGIKEKWFKYPDKRLWYCWDQIDSAAYWQEQKNIRTPESLQNFLKNYSGIGWYKLSISSRESIRGKKGKLFLPKVRGDISAWINGTNCTCLISINPDGSQSVKVPLEIMPTGEVRIFLRIDSGNLKNAGLGAPAAFVVD